KPLPVAQLLVTPLIDLADPAITASEEAGKWPLNAADLDIMVSHYAGAGIDPADPRISPAHDGMLVGQPKTLVVSAGHDPLAPQAEAFVRRLIAARVRTLYRRYDTLPLGFDLFAGLVGDASDAVRDMASLWREMLHSGRQADGEALDVA
ncbi:MAG: alpha/beta hydrolase fold domain-containing protein, partial [Asticcacaulis sp.]|nr:alpha/beta hydrolase fold domain-containing protein [Asticcacaulis sp.]